MALKSDEAVGVAGFGVLDVLAGLLALPAADIAPYLPPLAGSVFFGARVLLQFLQKRFNN
jgi:hypothetical protein